MISITVPGPPPRKNARGTMANGRRITPKRTRDWVARFDEAWLDVMRFGAIPSRLAKQGKWSVTIDVFERALRRLDVDVPLGDIDSCVSVILDAMQVKPKEPKTKWRPLDDDARIISLRVRKHYDKKVPRVEITLEQMTHN